MNTAPAHIPGQEIAIPLELLSNYLKHQRRLICYQSLLF